MPNCIQIQKPLKKVCTGDMRDRLTIQVRAITPPGDGGVDFTETFNQDKVVWALCQTKQGVEIFDGTGLKDVATHYFYIRYISILTKEGYVIFNGNYYTILDVQNLDERSEYQLLRCCLRGTTGNPVNQA